MHFPTHYSELFTFDYSNVFDKGHLYSYFIHPAVPIVSVALYLALSGPVCRAIAATFKLEPKGPFIQNLTIIHSLALAIYSGWTFYYSFNIVRTHMNEVGFWNAFCDVNHDLWVKANLGWWMTHFYISKYYEFIDTWIILLKGREPMFLQTYHHAGIVVLMWGFVATMNSSGLVILVLNSFIHTIMYTYYTLAALGYQSPLKHYLTQAQLIQFLVGIGVTVPLQFFQPCLTNSQSIVLGGVHFYTIGLIYLFGQFYYQSYILKKKVQAAKDAAESADKKKSK